MRVLLYFHPFPGHASTFALTSVVALGCALGSALALASTYALAPVQIQWEILFVTRSA